MKKLNYFAMMGAIALTGLVTFTACSSSEDAFEPNPDYNPETNTVKTEFSISLPQNVHAPVTRMTSTAVQQADNSFRGMQDIVLVPFAAKPTAGTETQQGDPITDFGNIAASGGLTNFSGTNTHYKVFQNKTVPVGTSAFLFYAQAIPSGTDFENGKTVKTPPVTAGTAGYTFVPSPIYDGSGNTIGDRIAAYLTQIARATGWSATTNAGLLALYNNFISTKVGSSDAVQRVVTDLWNTVKGNSDDVSTAIVTAITTSYASVESTALTFVSDASSEYYIGGYPANLNLPNGAAAVKWDETNTEDKKFVVDNSGNTVGTLTSYVYPASLWYRANTNIRVSNAKQTTNGSYPAAQTAWSTGENNVLGLYGSTDGAVTTTTRSIALVDVIQYAVGRLDVTVKCAAGTLYDEQGNAVTVDATNGFPVSAVLVGGQRAVNFEFTPSGTDLYTIYDKIPSGVNAKNDEAVGKNYTLVLETPADQDINIAVELTNNTGNDFYGHNGEVIPNGGKFYLTATLSKDAATETGSKVFKQDYYTTANLTILAGSSGIQNTTGLGAATNTIPDLRAPQMELGLSVDLSWQAGHSYNVDI